MVMCPNCDAHPATWECDCVLPGETTIQRPGFGLVPATRTPGVPEGRPTLAVRVASGTNHPGAEPTQETLSRKRAFAERT